MSVSNDPDWMAVSYYTENDDGETVEKTKECDSEDCEGTIYTNQGELVCGDCSAVYSEERDRRVTAFEIGVVQYTRLDKERHDEYNNSGTRKVYGGYESAYDNGGEDGGDYEFDLDTNEGFSAIHLRDWQRGGR